MTLPRSAADVLADHVVFEVECIDRMYLNVYVPQLQRELGLIGYLRGRLGCPIASTAPLAPITEGFSAAVRRYARDHGVPVVDFAKGQRKDDVMHEYLAAHAAAGGGEGVLFIGRAQEKTRLFRTEKRRDAAGASYPWIVKTSGVVNQWYFYCVDDDFGPFFLKFCSYFPFNAKLCLNGNHWAQRQAAKAGIGFDTLDNGFAAVDDPDGLQQICDGLGPDQIDALLRKWLRPAAAPVQPGRPGRRLSLRHLDPAGGVLPDPDAGQAGLGTDLLRPDDPRQPRHRPPGPDRAGLRSADLHPGTAPNPGTVPHQRDHQRGDPSLHVDYKNAKIKQYHKLGRALRTETTINDTWDFRIGKRLTNLPALRRIGFTANRRLLAVQRLSHDPVDGATALAQVTDPVTTDTGTRVAGLRLTDPRAQALLAILCVFRLLPGGFTNADLRHHLAPMLGKLPEQMTSSQITYDLRRLRHHGLIERIPHTFRYQLTTTGMRSALFLTRVNHRLWRTGLAELTDPNPPIPSRLRTADRAYQAAIDDLTHQAGLAA